MTSNQPFFEEEKLLQKLMDEEQIDNTDLSYDSLTRDELLKELKLLKAEYIQLAEEAAEREALDVMTPEELGNKALLGNIKVISTLVLSDSLISNKTKLMVEEVRNQSIYLYNSLQKM